MENNISAPVVSSIHKFNNNYEMYEFSSTPSEVPCAQYGYMNYASTSRLECRAMIGQLRREFLKEPEGGQLTIVRSRYEMDDCYYVGFMYDKDNDDHLVYFWKLDGEWPAVWDREARMFLDTQNYDERMEYNKVRDG